MPTKIEKDAVTGRETTGHEWDGIRELDTPTPKWWLYVFLATIVWALGMFVLYPAIPYGIGHTKGLLGYCAREKVDAEVAKLVDQRKVAMDRIGAMPFDAIMVTAAASHVPPPLLKQLKPGGRMIIPLGTQFMTQYLMLVEKQQDGSVTTRQILPVRFVPLTGRH